MNQTNGNAKLYGILAYIGILWLVGMFVQPEKDDPFVRFHVNQGIVNVCRGECKPLPLIGGFVLYK